MMMMMMMMMILALGRTNSYGYMAPIQEIFKELTLVAGTGENG